MFCPLAKQDCVGFDNCILGTDHVSEVPTAPSDNAGVSSDRVIPFPIQAEPVPPEVPNETKKTACMFIVKYELEIERLMGEEVTE